MARNISILFAFLLLSPTALFCQGSWERIDVPTQNWLRSVHFVDSLYGWATGNGGVILHTEDGGDSWTSQDSQTAHDIVDVFFLDQDQGWASVLNYTVSPYGTILLKTTDGGENWTARNYPQENIFMNCILFLDSLTGWMGGSPHALVRTGDGGITWQQASIDTATLAFFPVLKIEFYDDQYGYASGGMFDIAGVIWRTWDGGNQWYVIDVSDAPADEVRGLHTFDSLHVMGAGGDPDFGYGVGVIRTGDGGVNWEYEELGYAGNCYDLDFVSDTEAWAPLGPRRKFIYSTDAGEKWTEISTPDSTVILDVCFPDSLHGFAVGTEGTVLKYIPPEPVYITEIDIEENSQRLMNVYPNPFTSQATISFTIPINFSKSSNLPIPQSSNLPIPQSSNLPIPQSSYRPTVLKSYGHLKIEVLNLTGDRMATLADADFPPGEHRIVFDGSDLPAGVYICAMRLDAGEKILFDEKLLIRIE